MNARPRAQTPARPSTRAYPPRVRQIIDTARAVLEAEGADALTMRRIGELLGIRAPSLYKHLPNKRALEVALIEVALTEVGDALHRAARPERAVLGGLPAARWSVAGLLEAYRSYGLSNPNLYRLATTGQLPRADLSPGLEDWAGQPFELVTGDPSVARALWSAAHGMVILTLDGRYPPSADLAGTWAAVVAAFDARLGGPRAIQGPGPPEARENHGRASFDPPAIQGPGPPEARENHGRASFGPLDGGMNADGSKHGSQGAPPDATAPEGPAASYPGEA